MTVTTTARTAGGHRVSWLRVAAGAGIALALAGVATRWRTRAEERTHPPLGSFVDVDGVRLHVFEQGSGPPLLLLHGAGAMMQDMLLSGLVAQASARFRVVVVDRPGQGYTTRPEDRAWTPEAQADLLAKALTRLRIADAIVMGHSWGALVALALAVRHPARVAGLVLASGYYFATPRLDVPLMSSAALPLVGDLGRHTVLPLIGRAMWPAVMRRLFGPARVPPRFAQAFPKWLALRPAQLRAVAEDTAMLPAAAERLAPRASEIAAPVAIVVGRDDRLVDADRQSRRLHREYMPHAALHVVPGAGHMVHHTDGAAVMRVLDELANVVAAERDAVTRRLAPAAPPI